MQGEGREKRNDGGDSGPDKPGTSARVFCASSMFSISLFSVLCRQIPHLVRSSDLAPRKMEKDDAPMCSLPFNIFTETFESKRNFFESFTIAIRKITNATMIVTSTMTPTTVVTVDNTLKVARTAESEKPETLVFCYLCFSLTLKPDTNSKSTMKADIRRVLKVSWFITKVNRSLWKKHRIKMSIKY